MLSSRFLTLALVSLTAIAGVLARGLPKSSHAEPVKVESSMPLMSFAAGLTQETYCPSSQIKPGLKIGDAKLLWSTGDGYFIQRALIYHSDKLGIAVAYQGTNLDSLFSSIHNLEFIGVPPDWRYAKGLPEGTKLFYGFQDAYLQIVDKVYPAVQKYMHLYNETRVTVIGHSLGAAMGLVSAADFNYRIGTGVHNIYLYGLPRVGNPIFADWVDKTFGKKLHWAVSGKDWVPHVPPREFGYQHPSNYIWINPANSTNWKRYPGQENVHGFNRIQPDWLSFDDHQGVYFHTQIGAMKEGHCPATFGKD